ncbi:hypothetical protein D9M69_638650 [compost metagenome]
MKGRGAKAMGIPVGRHQHGREMGAGGAARDHDAGIRQGGGQGLHGSHALLDDFGQSGFGGQRVIQRTICDAPGQHFFGHEAGLFGGKFLPVTAMDEEQDGVPLNGLRLEHHYVFIGSLAEV